MTFATLNLDYALFDFICASGGFSNLCSHYKIISATVLLSTYCKIIKTTYRYFVVQFLTK